MRAPLNAVQPGIVSTSAGGSYGGSYGSGPSGSGSYGNGPYPSQGVQTASAQGSAYAAPGVGGSGRVVSVREVGLQGAGGGGGGNGALMGGLLGAGAGATIGAVTSRTLGGGLVGALLGAVGGAIPGTIADGQHGAGRGIEVGPRDDGQQVTVAQRDDGDIQRATGPDRAESPRRCTGCARATRRLDVS